MLLNIKRTCATLFLLLALLAPSISGGAPTAFASECGNDTVCPD